MASSRKGVGIYEWEERWERERETLYAGQSEIKEEGRGIKEGREARVFFPAPSQPDFRLLSLETSPCNFHYSRRAFTPPVFALVSAISPRPQRVACSITSIEYLWSCRIVEGNRALSDKNLLNKDGRKEIQFRFAKSKGLNCTCDFRDDKNYSIEVSDSFHSFSNVEN